MTPRILAPLAALVLLAAGCVGPGATQDEPSTDRDARVPTETWKDGLSTASFSGVASSLHRLSAPDGTTLSLTLHLPEGLPEDAQVPTLLQLTPYQPLAARTSTPATGTSAAGGSWAFFVERGAAYVEADARGTGGSGGCLDFGGAADRADAKAFADWVRAQPWSNGVVVTDGVSHPGMGSLVAHVADPQLSGALAHAPVVSYYNDEWYQGAKFENQFNGPAYQAIELAPPLYADPESVANQAAPCIGQTTLHYEQPDGRFGPLWQERDLSRHLDAARAPVLLTQGFVDLNVHPDHVQLYWDALPDDFPKHVIWGWWYHGWPDMEDHPAAEFRDVRHRWLDALLFGDDNGILAEPRVWVEDSRGDWHEGASWPLEPSEHVVLHASADGALAQDDAKEGAMRYHDALGTKRGRWDAAQPAHVAFRTEPLEEARLVNGAPRVNLVASSSEAETKWVAYLLDEAPDGSWQRVSHGYADSHTWAGEDRWEPMQPGRTYEWEIQLMPTAVVLEPGHRLVLLIASQDSSIDPTEDTFCFSDHRGGCYNPSGIRPAATAGRALNDVHTGPAGTRVHIAWVDPALTAKPVG